MSDKFDKLALFGSYISKNYARSILQVLYTYQDVSASEAASRIGLHINTVQEFLEAMFTLEIVRREEVSEKKRPHFRYKLISNTLNLRLDLEELFKESKKKEDVIATKIREKRNSFATFKRAKNNLYFGSVMILIGEGRDRKEKRINLTKAQGVFLYNLPFPDGKYQSIREIMRKSDIEELHLPEVMDMVNLLIEFQVVERMD